MRVAIIDLGTNTFNLVIGAIFNSKFKKIIKTKIPVKLGEGGIDKNCILPKPFQRGVQAMITYKEIIQAHQTDKIIAIATSAIRSAKNGNEFTEKVKEITGIEINVISGEREAELIYKGVRSALDIGKKPALIIDIGGGSTEFIIANNDKLLWKKSFDLGVSRLKELLRPSDPMTHEDIEKLETHLNTHLQPLINEITNYSITTLIGSSGSFDTFLDMILTENKPNMDILTTFDFQISELEQLHLRFLPSTFQERVNMKGMLEFRADMIVIASVFVQFLIKKLGIKYVKLSTYALKEGVIAELMEKQTN